MMGREDAEKEVAGEDAAKAEQAADSADQRNDRSQAGGNAGSAGNTGEDGEISETDRLIEEAVAAALAEQKDTVLRAQAEVQNMRRRCEQDVERAHKFALERFSTELLTVIDNLERALAAVAGNEDENIKPLKDGVELTLKGFLEICEKFNIRQMDPEGEPFDPQLHQAMSTVVNSEVEPNTVVNVVQKGYTLNDRVIRPAMVMVSRAE